MTFQYYKLLGYCGLIPFTLFMIGLFSLEPLTKDAGWVAACATMQLVYAGLILSFLAGMHWSHGLPRNHKLQLSLAMLPSVLSLPLVFFALLTYQFAMPLVFMALGFVAMYFADKKFLEPSWLEETYFKLRLQLTVIVSVCLFLSALSFAF